MASAPQGGPWWSAVWTTVEQAADPAAERHRRHPPRPSRRRATASDTSAVDPIGAGDLEVLAVARNSADRRERSTMWPTGAAADGRTSIRTEPRCPTGRPFPTLYYLTCPRATSAIGTLEADGVMREMAARLATDPDLAAAYRAGPRGLPRRARRARRGGAHRRDQRRWDA